MSLALYAVSGLVAAALLLYFFLFRGGSGGGVKVAARSVGAPPPSAPAAAASAGVGGTPSSAAGGAAGERLPLVRIYFGSQTGTAENYAKQLQREARKRGFAAQPVDLAGFGRGAGARAHGGDASELLRGGGLALFLMATYGEGDPTDSAQDFARWLKAERAPDGADARPLAGLSFSVFGLGNRQYQFYNKMGKVRAAAPCAAPCRAPPARCRVTRARAPTHSRVLAGDRRAAGSAGRHARARAGLGRRRLRPGRRL